MQNPTTENNWCIAFVWPTDCFTSPLSFSNCWLDIVPKRIWSMYIWVTVSWFISVKLKKCTCRYCLSAFLNYLAVHTQSWKSFFPSNLSCPLLPQGCCLMVPRADRYDNSHKSCIMNMCSSCGTDVLFPASHTSENCNLIVWYSGSFLYLLLQ